MKANYKAVLCIFSFGLGMLIGGIVLQDKLEVKNPDRREVIVTYASRVLAKEELDSSNKDNIKLDKKNEKIEKTLKEEKEVSTEEVEKIIVYDNMTMDELTVKLDRSLNSNIAGYGYLFASRSIELGIDPYLAVAIVLHETGCKWECSTLVKQCNNVGGQKGGPSCNGGSYKSYNTLEEGINGYMENLYNNYYAVGLNTPELMNSKYAASTTWAEKINNYILEIKAK